MPVGHPTDLDTKVEGDHSLSETRGSPEGVYGVAPLDPRDRVRAGLLEAQFPAVEGRAPRYHTSMRGHRHTTAGLPRSESSGRWAVVKETTQGNERATYVALETSSVRGSRGLPTGRES